MGSQYVDGSQGWGSLLGGVVSDFEGAPGKALSNIHAAEVIKTQRMKRAQEEEQWNANRAARDAYEPALPRASEPNVPVELSALPTVDAAGNWTTPDAGDQFKIPNTWIDPAANADFQRRRALAAAGGGAAILKDPAQWAPQLGYGTVATAGTPNDPRARSDLQYLTTGRFPTDAERNIATPHNFTVNGPDGQPTGQLVTTNNMQTTVDGRQLFGAGGVVPPGHTLAITGPAPQTAANPIETEAIAQNNFEKLAIKAQKGPLTADEIQSALQLRRFGWPQTVEQIADPETKEIKYVTRDKTPLPTQGASGYLNQLLDGILRGDHTLPAPTTPTAVPFAGAGGLNAAGTSYTTAPTVIDSGGAALNAVPAPGTPGAAPPSPIVPVTPQGPRVSIGAPVTGGEVSSLAKEYTNQRRVDDMEQARTGYNSMVSNMPFDNPASDLAIVIGAAKTLDPPSVVREKEGENVQKTGGVMDRFIGAIDRASGGAGLTPQMRVQIWQMVNEKLTRDIADVNTVREQYAVRIKQRQGDPETLLPPLPKIVPIDTSIISKRQINADVPGSGYPQTQTQPQRTPEDVQAREWATKNPTDPRAKAILERLGVQ